MVQDKTQLERDIERHEMIKIPLSVFILVVLLSIGLGVIGVYTFKLKQELSMKEQEIVLIKRNYQNQKQRLLKKIKRLEGEQAKKVKKQ